MANLAFPSDHLSAKTLLNGLSGRMRRRRGQPNGCTPLALGVWDGLNDGGGDGGCDAVGDSEGDAENKGSRESEPRPAMFPVLGNSGNSAQVSCLRHLEACKCATHSASPSEARKREELKRADNLSKENTASKKGFLKMEHSRAYEGV